MRERYEAYPSALRVLSAWEDMPSATRPVICHWHLQLADPLYRKFTGEFLPDRDQGGFATLSRSVVARWIQDTCSDRWQTTTRNQFARKLLYSAADAGLLKTVGKEWSRATPRIDGVALTYLLYLLRETDFEGTLTNNAYLRSLGIDASLLATKLQASSAVQIHRQSDLVEFTWQYESLNDWAESIGVPVESRREELHEC